MRFRIGVCQEPTMLNNPQVSPLIVFISFKFIHFVIKNLLCSVPYPGHFSHARDSSRDGSVGQSIAIVQTSPTPPKKKKSWMDCHKKKKKKKFRCVFFPEVFYSNIYFFWWSDFSLTTNMRPNFFTYQFPNIHDTQRMNPNDFGLPLNFTLILPWGWYLWFWMIFLNKLW